ncbi:carbon starvation CstA family protein [Mangrovactinospora gilvigrisea]|uniref:carbon starvation CstA family protein n=1 Tax=Mangrovactinospora gilvigrisea TaxID=1428644 RepID=UPI0008FC99CA|nr:carbon starvation CstA family protein [Mangrovactinospora gilvigrisea]
MRGVVTWTLVALVGAAGWTVLALARGEHVSAAWMLAAALGSYAIGYRFYARFITRRALRPDPTRATPAERLDDGVDFHPTDKRVLFGHHFAAIAGAGPLVGPVMAAQMGYLPGTVWIIVGVVLGGAVQDMVTLFFSMRRDGRSLGQIARDELGPVKRARGALPWRGGGGWRVGGYAALVSVLAIMIIILAVLALVVVNALASSPWGTFSISMTIPIALLMGVWMRFVRPGRVLEASIGGAVLLLIAIVAGRWVAESPGAAGVFTLSPKTLVVCLVVYGFVAAVLPVWTLLAPRDYLSTFMKIGTIALMAIGVVVAMPSLDLRAPAISSFAHTGSGPVFAGSLFPFVFITIACGALSGFHALISSGTTPKMIEKETQVRLIGYGGMLAESFVAIMAIIAATVLDPGLFYAMNAPASVLGETVQSASHAVAGFGFSIRPHELAQVAKDVGENSILARTGGAPTFAVGLSFILHTAFGGNMQAFWYHFAVMFEALFILTTVDAGTRVGRFMLQDLLGNAHRRFRDPRWRTGQWLTTAVIVAAWGYFLWAGVTDPLGGINQLYPLFGIANQLLAAVALGVCTVLMVKSGRAKWAWITGLPLAWDVAVTMTASWQKLFSADPKLGFFAQADTYRDAIAAGKVLPPAKTLGDMHTVVTNSTVDGVLLAVFVLLVLVVLADGLRVSLAALRLRRSGLPVPTAEAPYVPSARAAEDARRPEPAAAER